MHCNFASLLVPAFLALPSIAQTDEVSFNSASADIKNQLEVAIAELAELRDRIASETIPMSRKLSALEAELQEVRSEYDSTVRVLDGRTLDLTNLAADIKSRNDEASYLNNLLSEFIRNFEPRLRLEFQVRPGRRQSQGMHTIIRCLDQRRESKRSDVELSCHAHTECAATFP